MSKRHMSNEKLLMAEILYKLGQVQSSVDLFIEVQKSVNDKNEYNRISKLIDEYRNEIIN